MVEGVAGGEADGVGLPFGHGDAVAGPVDGVPASPVGRGAVRYLVGSQTHTPRKSRGLQMSFDFLHGAWRGGKGVNSFLPFLPYGFFMGYVWVIKKTDWVSSGFSEITDVGFSWVSFSVPTLVPMSVFLGLPPSFPFSRAVFRRVCTLA